VQGFLAGVTLSQLVERQRAKTVSVVHHPKSRHTHSVSA
jgi:hypothetical protein